MATIQEQIKERLESLPIATKEIKVFGQSIIIKCASLDTANQWVPVLSKFAKLRGKPVEFIDDLKADAHLPNKRRTCKVWLVGASM